MAFPTKLSVPASGLDFRLNEDIPESHHGLLAATLNDPWSWLILADSDIIARRLESKTPVITAYDANREDDFIPSVDLRKYGREIPVVTLEMVFLKTNGIIDNVPKLYRDLTNSGLWQPIPDDYDTVIFVDLTSIPSRRGQRGSGEAKETVYFAQRYLSGMTSYTLPFDPSKVKFRLTYSPDLGGIIRMHTDFGAKDDNRLIPHARDPFLNDLRELTRKEFESMYPNHDPRLHHVRMMNYSG